jgi:nuclear GTP-binding protein
LRSLTQCRGNKQTIGVSPRPGFTTSLQEVVLDKQVRLLDSPGVVFDDSSALLCNCVDAESMDDPVAAVEAMLQRCTHQSLVLTYNLPHFVPGNVDMFLALMAKKHGRVTKGGIPDKVSAARGVLRDWNSGKIPFYTTPPAPNDEESDEQRRVSAASAVIVPELGEDFLRKLDEQVLSGLPDNNQQGTDAMDYLELTPTDPTSGRSGLNFDDDDEDDDEDDDDDDDDDGDEVEEDSDMDMAEESQDYDFNEMA